MKELFSRDSIVYGEWNPHPSCIFPFVNLRYDKSVPTGIRNAVRLGALEQNVADEKEHKRIVGEIIIWCEENDLCDDIRCDECMEFKQKYLGEDE